MERNMFIAGCLVLCIGILGGGKAVGQTRPHFSQLEDVYCVDMGDESATVTFPATAEIMATTLELTSLRVGGIPAGATTLAATGAIFTGPVAVFNGSDLYSGVAIGKPGDYFQIYHDGDYAKFLAARDIYIDPTWGGLVDAIIVPCAPMAFPDDLGDKMTFYSDSYAIGVSPFDLDIRSDQNIKFHSDTNEDAAVLNGDTGTLGLEGNLGVATTTPTAPFHVTGDHPGGFH